MGITACLDAKLNVHFIRRVDEDKVIATVVAVERRKEGDKSDVCLLAKKLLKLRLLE